MLVRELIDAYLEEKVVEEEARQTTERTARYRARHVYGPVMDWPVERITGEVAAKLLQDLRLAKANWSPVTFLNALKEARAVWEYALADDLVAEPVWDTKGRHANKRLARVVRPVRKAAAKVDVKPSLKIDEARALTRVLHQQAMIYPRGTGGAALVALWCGLRSGEVLGLTPESTDDGGARLWILKTKTRKPRPVPVPEFAPAGDSPVPLRALLLAAAADTPPGDRLFQSDRHRLLVDVKAYCRQAGVREMTCHGLRRTFATLHKLSSASRTYELMGHTNESMNRKHYYAKGTVETVEVADFAAVMAGQKKP